MILKAKERGNAAQLAQYLMQTRDNDHVELHQVRGFISEDLLEAFHEADAIARGTRCEKNVFSLSLNPPQAAEVSTEAFEKAINEIEQTLGLERQPRAVVFHEKDGRRHAHAVWSRIDIDRMRAINLPFYKERLRTVSRELFLEHGWTMPRGLEDRRLRDPQNFTREEWQQSRRVGLDPRELKAMFRKTWEASDNRTAFEQALKERGFWLAQGNRRGFVAVDYRGEAYSLSRYTGVKTKEQRARLGKPDELDTVSKVRAEIADRMTAKIERFIKDAERDAKRRNAVIDFQKAELVGRHRDERAALKEQHEKRWQAETKERAERLPKGMSGIWHRLTGRYGKIREQNEREAYDGLQRDRAEKDALIVRQLDERQVSQAEIRIQRAAASQELFQLREDAARYLDFLGDKQAFAREKTKERDSGDNASDDPTRTQNYTLKRRSFDP